jgi:hypothetical protein
MNKTKQFWALVKFVVSINPAVFFFPLALAAPYYIPYLTRLRDYHPDLGTQLFNQNTFFVGLIGFFVLAPEIMQTPTVAASWPTGTEFLLTRAVDRHLVLRARSAFFYLLILAIPLCVLFGTLRTPSLQIREYDKVLYKQVLSQIPGSMPLPAERNQRADMITIPNGNALVASWHIWQFLSLAVITQVFVLLISRLKYRRLILFGTYSGLILIPLLAIMRIGRNAEGPSLTESMFFSFVSHQWLIWLTTIAALLLAQLWCERRFANSEH